MEITFVNKDDIFQYYNDNTPADEMIFKRTPSKSGGMSNSAIRLSIWTRSRPSWRDFVREPRTSMKCGSSLSREASLSTSPTLQCTMRRRISRCAGVCSGYSTLPWDWYGLFPWIRIRRKNELRTRIYEGNLKPGSIPRLWLTTWRTRKAKSLRRRPRRTCQRCYDSLWKPLGCLSVLAW